MTGGVHQAREALGLRLRELRKDAGLTGRQLAALAGWPSSKVSKVEHGKQTPSEDDIHAWCLLCRAPDQQADLLASVRNVEAMYLEWRRILGTGTRKRQVALLDLGSQTQLFRWYEPLLVPGLLHTAEYATAIFSRLIAFFRVPDDLPAGVAARMERQHVLYQGNHRFHFIMAEQALLTMVGGPDVMIGQLDRLLNALSLPRVDLGILPARSAYRVPTNQFVIFDERVVYIETISAELTINQPREIALYGKVFQELAASAVYGKTARDIIAPRLAEWREETEPTTRTHPPHEPQSD